MDCLICHDTTGKYKKDPPGAGMPKKDVDLKLVAQNVGHSSRASCGSCHFNGGGGDAVKHADLSRQLLEPSRNCDVHMGGYDFSCAECHNSLAREPHCGSCHQSRPDVDFGKLVHQGVDFTNMARQGRDVNAPPP